MKGDKKMVEQLRLSELKRHAMTGVSYMLPLVVASGLLIAIGVAANFL